MPRSPLSPRILRAAIPLTLVAAAGLFWFRAASTAAHSLTSTPLQALERQARTDPDSQRIAYALGRRRLQLGNLADAHVAFQNALRRDPNDEAACIGAAVTATGSDATTEAATILKAFLTEHSASGRAHLALGQVYRRVKAHEDAYYEAVKATQLSPGDPDAWKLLGGEAFALGHSQQAQEALRKALGLRPRDWQADIALGDLLLRTQRPAEGIECVRTACRAEPTEPLPWQILLRNATTPQEHAYAQEGLDRANDVRNGVPPPPDSLSISLPGAASLPTLQRDADWLLRQKRLPEAQQAYLAILAVNPSAAPALQGVGLALSAMNRREDAFFYLQRATDLDPNLAPAQYLLGDWFLQASFKKEAARRLQLASDHAPDNAACWHALGQAEGALEVENGQAEAAYRRAVALDPNNVAYLLDLADMLALNSKAAEAETVYRRACALGPNDPDALARLGGFLIDDRPDTARQQEADHLLRTAIRLDPDSDFAWYQFGRLAYLRGHDPEAIAALRRAVTLVPQIQEGWYALSRALARSGDRDQAEAAMQTCQRLRAEYQDRTHTAEILKLQPHNDVLHLKLARLYTLSGENAKALYEYTSYLRLRPQDVVAHREQEQLTARLKASGHLPSMTMFGAMVESSLHHNFQERS